MTAPGTSKTIPFRADCVRNDNQLLLRLSGRLVNARPLNPAWHACVERLASADVRVDLANVTEIDARGLGMLADLARQARDGGGRLVVVSASPRVRRLLTLTRLDELVAA